MVFLENNVSTDNIFPNQHLNNYDLLDYSQFLFSNSEPKIRLTFQSAKEKGVKILIVGKNFGYGSSREQAVWALHDCGFKIIISSQLPIIFKRNLFNYSILPIELDMENIQVLSNNITLGIVRNSISVDIRKGLISNDLEINIPFSNSQFELLVVNNIFDSSTYQERLIERINRSTWR